MDNHEPVVERLNEYTEEDAAGIGRLMPFLSARFNNEPIAEELLKEIIESPMHDQIVARLDGLIVGTATMSLIMGAGGGREGYLQDFVVDESRRGQGVADRIWEEIIEWCQDHDVDLSFTSNPKREAAHRFYLNHGAIIRQTTVFHVPKENQWDL